MRNSWIEACKEYRSKSGTSVLPKKGTKEYDEIRSIQETLKGNKGSGIKEIFEGGIDKISSLVEQKVPASKNSKPLEPGERHSKKMTIEDGKLTYENYQFLGPGTKVKKRVQRGDKGINNLDKAARQHDLDYTYELREKLRQGLLTKKDVRDADNKFLEKVERYKNEDPLTAKVTKTAFKTKKIAEDAGLLPISSFFDETTGEGLKPKKKGRPKKGGGLKEM